MRIVKPIAITDSTLVSSSVPETEAPAYNPAAAYALGHKVMSAAHRVYECIKQESSVVTFTASGNAVVTWANHGLTNGRFVSFASTGSVPTGITSGTIYTASDVSQNSFTVADTAGRPIAITSAGTGTITAKAYVNLFPDTNPKYWLDIGSTNRWKMFDKTVQSQTTAVGSFTTTISVNSYFDTIAFLNVTGTTLQVVVRYGADIVYNNTISLVSSSEPVKDLWSYLLAGFKQRRDVILDDLPPYAGTTITVTISGSAGTTVGIGALLVGLARDISSEGLGVEQGAKQGIDDYSVKKRDDFGNYIITERAFSKRASYTIFMRNSEIDDIQNFLTEIRATPVLYLGSRKYASSAVYGFYKSWEVDIAYPDYSVCTIELNGLT